MSDSVFAALKNRAVDAHQMDTDGIASCLSIMAQNLDKLLPDTQKLFTNLTAQMSNHLTALRNRRFNAYEAFTGKGPIARKLREHLTITEWFEPTGSERLQGLAEQIDEVFDKKPTTEEKYLEELKAFIKLTQPLMVGQSMKGQEFQQIDPNVALPSLQSGFYVAGEGIHKRFSMVLNAFPSNIGIKISYVLTSGQDEVLLFQHPEESEWFQSNYTFTFPYVVDYLKRELDAVIEPLGFRATITDMDLELQNIFHKVTYILDRHLELPRTGLKTVFHDAVHEQTEIKIPFGPEYHWSFLDTRGKYPSRTNRFFYHVGTSVQPHDPKDFNEFSRQNMIKFVNRELDEIMLAMVPVAAEAA
jgi:hypothetical protein